MMSMLKTILEKGDEIGEATIDDILVNETTEIGEEVINHLGKFELVVKTPKLIEGGAALGL